MAIKTLKNLSVPEEAGCIFTRPDFNNWPYLLRKNRDLLAAIDNRNTSRSELVNIATEYTHRMGLTVPYLKSATEDIIVTGHQPNWHHCGIFAKNIVTGRFARQTCGIAVQLVLDHDICNTSMSFPESDNNRFLRLKTIALEQKHQKIPLESRPVPSKEQLRKFIDSVSKISIDPFCSEIWCRNTHRIIENTRLCKSAADIITQLQARLNKAFGLEIIYLPVSLMSQSNSFIDFVYSVICDAVSFVGIYNKAIKNKRKTCNLKPNQTLRSLKTDYLNNIIELPFWFVSRASKRASLYVSLNDKSLRIGTADNVAGIIDSSGNKKEQLLEILVKNKCVIRPKAVTLTLFTRLYLADLFVHGTGAANYEYITDYLIRDYYKISKLSFGVATATMTLPANESNREFFFGLFTEQKLKKLIDFKEAEDEDSLNCCSSSR
ncbi:MAG: hypothetical protein ACYS9Y_08560 [Planctomycetota bacterium]|jgi:hypothetical protein